jgi:hypothetical protein
MQMVCAKEKGARKWKDKGNKVGSLRAEGETAWIPGTLEPGRWRGARHHCGCK